MCRQRFEMAPQFVKMCGECLGTDGGGVLALGMVPGGVGGGSGEGFVHERGEDGYLIFAIP